MESPPYQRNASAPRLVIFGATGTTGAYVLRAALADGIHVRAAVRSPAKLPPDLVEHERLEIFEADVTDAEAAVRPIAGATMIFIALGYTGRPDGPVLVPFIHEVVRAMREHGVPRLVYQASGISSVPGRPNPALIRFFLRPVIGLALGTQFLWREHDAVIRFLTEDVRDLDWTVTRPGVLSDRDSRGMPVAVESRGGALSYQDLAAFSWEILRSGAYPRACPYLQYSQP